MRPEQGADAMNLAVARITGMKRSWADVSDGGPTKKPLREENENSLDQKIPEFNMPPKKAEKQPGVEDYDDEAEEIVNDDDEKKEHIMNKAVAETGLTSMAEWRSLAGITPLFESERGTGQVPTPGVNKQNKMKAGLAGLEGQAVQDVEPEGYGDDGEGAEETLDQNVADLKKDESYNRHFTDFLAERGLTPGVFSQLIDEAMASDDVEEMNALLAVEGMFSDLMKRRKTTDTDDNMNQLKRTMKAAADRKAGKVDQYGAKVSLRQAKAGVGQMPGKKTKGFSFECDDDGKGNPDWMAAFKKMSGR